MSATSKEIFTYDLMSTLRKDPLKARKVQESMERIDSIQTSVRQGKSDASELGNAMASLVPLCGFNLGLLMPHYFKRYPQGKPLSYIERPFMFAMSSMSSNSVVTLRAGRQVGKCADGNSVVETENGATTLFAIFQAGCAIP